MVDGMTGSETLFSLASGFALAGKVRKITPLGDGLINDTWLVATDRDKGVLQRINGAVFPRPAWNMANLRRVIAHLEDGKERDIRLPKPIPTRGGADWLEERGGFWRMLEYIEGITLKGVDSRETARSLGWSLGRLHALLADLDPAGFHDTLPGFHVTSAYLSEFDRALSDWRGLACAELSAAVSRIEAHRGRAEVLERADLPRRIVHGDPKLDNVIFDVSRRRPLAWVDLDTLKPGSVLYDIGDCVRAACGKGGRLDMELAAALLSGWHEAARRFLTAVEIDLVPHAVWLLPFELGLRFLTDFLSGNRYFRVDDPEENLRRAQDQLALARDVDSRFGRLSRIWREISATPGK